MLFRVRNQSRNSERGIALVELALAIPVVLVFVGGLISVSMTLRDKRTLANASREAARVAASYSLKKPACYNPKSAPKGTTDCVKYNSLECVSNLTATDFLRRSGLAPEGIKVQTQIYQKSEGPVTMDLIQIQLEQKDPASCLFCFNNLLNLKKLKSESVFRLQGACV